MSGHPAAVALMRGYLYDLTDVDDVFLAIVGYAREDFERGLSWRDLTPPEYLHLDEAGMRQAAIGGFTAPYQKEFIRKDGTRVPVLLVCAFIPGMDGHWMGYVVSLEAPRPLGATIADATEPLDTQLKVEMLTRLVSELVRERARTLAMLDHAPMLLWSVDRESRLSSANAPFHDACARANAGASIEVGDELFDPPPFTGDPTAWRAAHARALREPFGVEVRGEPREERPATGHADVGSQGASESDDGFVADGHRDWECRFVPIEDANGDVVGAAVVAQDVTSRVQAEANVRASEALFRSLAESLPVGVCLLGPDGQMTYANRACTSLGHERSTTLRDAVRKAATELRRDDLLAVVEHTRELVPAPAAPTAQSDEGRVGAAAPLAPTRALLVRITRLEGAYLGIVEDETAREPEARRALQREKMESLGALAGGVAHDFNNLLGIVLGFTERALEDPTSTEESLASIRTAALRARSLVRQILTFGRRHEHAPTLLDLGALVTETTQLLRAAVPSTLVLETRIGREPVVVRGDPAALQTAIVNLCTNAAYALRGRSIGSIVVRCEATSNTMATLSVSDDGPGFPPEVANRLFEPFFTTKPVGEGTGMGLALVRGIVASHGGEISAATSSRGATFTLRLPRVEEPLVVTPRITPPPAVRARVLLVEDEPLLAQLIERTLSAAGHVVTFFPTGDEAWVWLSDLRNHIDLVLTDITMTGMSGRELLERTRALRPELRGILMSGNVELGLGGDRVTFAILEKPFLAPELLETLDRAFGG